MSSPLLYLADASPTDFLVVITTALEALVLEEEVAVSTYSAKGWLVRDLQGVLFEVLIFAGVLRKVIHSWWYPWPGIPLHVHATQYCRLILGPV
jgi:hypothetical protein